MRLATMFSSLGGCASCWGTCWRSAADFWVFVLLGFNGRTKGFCHHSAEGLATAA